VTAGDEKVMDGELAPDETEPEEPEEDDPDEVEPDEDGVVVVVAAPEPELPDGVVTVPEPVCSLATTTPMTAVSPVAASTAPRVRKRTRDQAC
jgi:hypothetical protein